MSEAATIERRLAELTSAVHLLAVKDGRRLSRAEVCARLGVHRNTLARYIDAGSFPKPTKMGDWLLADVIKWESQR